MGLCRQTHAFHPTSCYKRTTIGSRGETAVIKELSQLRMYYELEPKRIEGLTAERAAALAYLMFVKENGLVEGALMEGNIWSTCPKKRTMHQQFQ